MFSKSFRATCKLLIIKPAIFILMFVLGGVFSTQCAGASPVGEVEPNDTLLTTNVLLPGQYGEGRILSGPEFDGWVIPNVHTDEYFCILLNAIEAGPGNADPIVSVYYNKQIDTTSNSDFYNDDGGPPAEGFRDSLLCGEQIKHAGSLFLRADGFGSSVLDPYDIYQVVVAPNEVLPEVEPNDSVQSAMPVQSPAILANGSVDADFYSFYANKDEKIVVMIDQDPGRPTPTTPFATSLQIIDSDGVTDISESVAGEHLNGTGVAAVAAAYGALPAPHSGTFYIKITKAVDSGGVALTEDGEYRITVLVDGASPLTGACCREATCDQRAAVNCRGKFGGVGSQCGGDIDGDGIADGCDNCKSTQNDTQLDFDADEVGDVCDTCSTDRLKVIPGACGCGTTDKDSDGDGVADCNDQCPSDGRESVPGVCGCGVLEADTNANGVIDCLVGQDVKASLQAYLQSLGTQLAAIKNKKPSKTVAASINAILAQIQAAIQAGGSQVVVSKAGFDLSGETSKLSQTIAKTLKSSAKRLKKNKAASQLQLQAIVAALA